MAKIDQNRPISAVVGGNPVKHPKLQLPQRVEHVSNPQKWINRHIYAPNRDFIVKLAPRQGKMGYQEGTHRTKIGQKSLKNQFYQIAPKSVSGGGKPIFGPLEGLRGLVHVPTCPQACPIIGPD